MIKQQGKGKDNHRRSSKEKDIEEWSRICYGEGSIKGQKELGKIAAFREWENTWPHQSRNEALRQRPTADPEAWNASKIYRQIWKGKIKPQGNPISHSPKPEEGPEQHCHADKKRAH
ncbi:hypothetical protein K3495_g4607 [Podosphaera aphanis]|nr:hypothetical protein K3495_g4607 [Podosphaera aphanis]